MYFIYKRETITSAVYFWQHILIYKYVARSYNNPPKNNVDKEHFYRGYEKLIKRKRCKDHIFSLAGNYF